MADRLATVSSIGKGVRRLTATTYVAMSTINLSYPSLVAGMLAANILMLFVNGAHQGLLALIGQENRMSGRLAVVWQTVAYVPVVGGSYIGGVFAEKVAPTATFMILAAASAALALFALWKPKAVFDHAYDQPKAKAGRPLGGYAPAAAFSSHLRPDPAALPVQFHARIHHAAAVPYHQ